MPKATIVSHQSLTKRTVTLIQLILAVFTYKYHVRTVNIRNSTDIKKYQTQLNINQTLNPEWNRDMIESLSKKLQEIEEWRNYVFQRMQ